MDGQSEVSVREVEYVYKHYSHLYHSHVRVPPLVIDNGCSAFGIAIAVAHRQC